MPKVTGDRFTSSAMSDCEFCPPEGRHFRTTRQCTQCNRPLCLVCRPQIPGQPYLCPECGGGPVENALYEPHTCIERLTAAGHTVPYWLVVVRERLVGIPAAEVEELIVPE